ncbi:MAG: hypothetical protein ACR2RE_25315 [Geminicoccaceae bacterium]
MSECWHRQYPEKMADRSYPPGDELPAHIERAFAEADERKWRNALHKTRTVGRHERSGTISAGKARDDQSCRKRQVFAQLPGIPQNRAVRHKSAHTESDLFGQAATCGPQPSSKSSCRDLPTVIISPALRTRVAPPKVPVKPGDKLLKPSAETIQDGSWRKNSSAAKRHVGRQNRKQPVEITQDDLNMVDKHIAQGKVTKCADGHAAGAYLSWAEQLF